MHSQHLKYWLFIIYLGFAFSASFAQTERTKNWYFVIKNKLQFAGNSPTVGSISTTSYSNIGGSSAISDSSGNVLMFSDGNRLFDASENTMPNGTGLAGSSSATQTSIIVPNPSLSSRYYLFTISDIAAGNGFNFYEVEMSLNGGLGDIIPVGPTQLLDSTSEKVCATRHANDIDYWVVTHRWESNEFHAFLVNSSGVSTVPVVSSVGIVHTNASGSGERTGQMKISPDGTKIATANFSSGVVQLYDFDAETGTISNPLTLTPGIISQFPFGVEFSADSKKFYYGRRVSNGIAPVGIHQFDLEHVNIDCLLASEIEFANVSEFKIICDLQLASDKKIYISYYAAGLPIQDLSIINQPQNRCPECLFVDTALHVNNSLQQGLTNFTSSYLSDGIRYEFGSNCLLDTTIFWPDDTFRLDSVKWSFGDPSSGAFNFSTSIYATHYYNYPDTYDVQLIAFRENRIDTFRRETIIWNVTENLLGDDTTICQGNSLTLDASWYNSCLAWFDGSSSITKTVNQTGWYWVDMFYQPCHFRDSIYIEVVNDIPSLDLGPDTTICEGDSFVFDPDFQLATYTWSNGSHDTTYTASNQDTVWLTLSNACGNITDTAMVNIKTGILPSFQLPHDTIICDTASFSVDASTDGGASYLWENASISPIRTFATSGDFWIQISNECGVYSDSMTINTAGFLISDMLDSALYCGAGDTISLHAEKNDNEAIWNNGDTANTIYVTQAGVYWFTAINECGSLEDTTYVVDFDTNFSFSLPPDSISCYPSNSFEIGYKDTNFAFTYTWNTGLTSEFEQVLNPGMYILTLMNKCVWLSDTFNYSIAEPAKIIAPETRDLCKINALILKPTVAEFESISWNQFFHESSYRATMPGVVEMILLDTNGCLFSDTIELTENCKTTANPGNVFTPNADGINDIWCTALEYGEMIQLSIYNRWGLLMFEARDERWCWDGFTNGSPAAEGTYFYVINVLNQDLKTIEIRGTLMLLR